MWLQKHDITKYYFFICTVFIIENSRISMVAETNSLWSRRKNRDLFRHGQNKINVLTYLMLLHSSHLKTVHMLFSASCFLLPYLWLQRIWTRICSFYQFSVIWIMFIPTFECFPESFFYSSLRSRWGQSLECVS